MAVGSNRMEGNLHVTGTLSAQQVSLPAGCVTNDSVLDATGIAATKLQHQHQTTTWLCDHATAAAATRRAAHVVYGATGSVIAFGAGSTVLATSSGNAVVDLKKNGTTILTAAITLDTGNVAYTLEAAAGFTSTALVAGDVLEVSINSVSGSNDPKGVFARLVIREDAA